MIQGPTYQDSCPSLYFPSIAQVGKDRMGKWHTELAPVSTEHLGLSKKAQG